MTEISIRPHTGQTVPAETEPTLILTQLQNLLREAAAYERAQRPIVLHTAPAHPAATPHPAGHPGIDVTIPAPPAPVTIGAEQGEGRRFTLAELVGWCGLGVAGSSLVTMLALALAGSPDVATAGIAAAGGFAASLGAAIAGTREDDARQARAWQARKAAGQ